MILRSEIIAKLLRDSDTSRDPLCVVPYPDSCIDELEKAGSSSIDLRLGTWFVVLKKARISHLKFDDEPNPSEIIKSHYVPFGNSFILHPRNFVLAITLEWLRIPSNLAGSLVGKSSWGRRGLIIATAAGVHPGFRGCLTLELSNVGEIPIALAPGIKICQLALYKTEASDDAIQDKLVDQSSFIGQRKPSLGSIKKDWYFESLVIE